MRLYSIGFLEGLEWAGGLCPRSPIRDLEVEGTSKDLMVEFIAALRMSGDRGRGVTGRWAQGVGDALLYAGNSDGSQWMAALDESASRKA